MTETATSDSESAPKSGAPKGLRFPRVTIPLSVALCLFTLLEVNYQQLNPLAQIATFVLFGMTLSFLTYPLKKGFETAKWAQGIDIALAVASALCCGYIVFNENGLAQRAGGYNATDIAVAVAGIFLALEATRRSIGLALPILSMIFLIYAFTGPNLPGWMFPHRGYDLPRVASQIFLRTEGVFGMAASVMFRYVFLFVLFGSFLEASGGTQFIVRFAKRLFGTSGSGAAKVGVLGSGLMGSLSGSAVANAVTTGTFTIPMMRSSGLQPHIAGGITAAAAAGGALVPPVMGAGAYMMLEIVEPQVTFVEIVKAATLPAILYYLSIFLIVHFYAKRSGIKSDRIDPQPEEKSSEKRALIGLDGLTFFGALGLLIGLLISGISPTRAVTGSLGWILLMTIINPKVTISRQARVQALIAAPVLLILTKLALQGMDPENANWGTSGVFSMTALLLAGLLSKDWRPIVRTALVKSANNGVSLICASACVGVVIAVVTLTGIGTEFPATIIPIAENNLFLALVALMVCSIVLGMGLPSAVCYLLLAILIGPALNQLGVPPLAAHLFIFYFGMMSMVTPPVALAAYASASIANSDIMKTGFAAFRFSLVGFTLPFMFVYRPELLLMSADGGTARLVPLLITLIPAIIGIAALASALAGYLRTSLNAVHRGILFGAAACILFPDSKIQVGGIGIAVFDLIGVALYAVVFAIARKREHSAEPVA